MGYAAFAKCQCESLINTPHGDYKNSKERVSQMFCERFIHDLNVQDNPLNVSRASCMESIKKKFDNTLWS